MNFNRMVLSPKVIEFLPEIWPICIGLLQKKPKLTGPDYYLLAHLRSAGRRLGEPNAGPTLSVARAQKALQTVGVVPGTVSHALARLEKHDFAKRRLLLQPERTRLTHEEELAVFGVEAKKTDKVVVLRAAGEERLKRFDQDFAALFSGLLSEFGLTTEHIAAFARPLKDKAPQIVAAVRKRAADMADDRVNGNPNDADGNDGRPDTKPSQPSKRR